MKLCTLFENKKAVFSFEVFPPKKTSPVETIYKTLESLECLHPDYISVTYGAGGNAADNTTCDIALLIKNTYKIEPVAHLTGINFNKEEAVSVIHHLEQNGIENVLALRGDRNPDIAPKTDFPYAADLITMIKQSSSMDVAAACYPEGHPECDNLELDILHLKAKVDAGATHLVSQLFFDNEDFYNFMYRIREAGITVPVQAGIMPVVNRRQIERMVSMCGASLPKKFAKTISKYEHSDEALRDAGIAYATEQIVDLLSNNVQGIHLYTMNNPIIAKTIGGNIASILKYMNS